MGNINDVWYLKSAGGSWADTKCALDDCYSIPFDVKEDDELFLQVEVPMEDVNILQIWLTDLNGARIENIMPITDWRIITGNGMYRLIFRVKSTKVCREYAPGKRLDCFRFEVPLMTTKSPSVEIDTLMTEPFHCVQCEETLKISSDYCFKQTDIFGEFYFYFNGLGTAQYGGLAGAKNDLRIQAKLKQLPSQVKATRNLRCFNYSSKLQQRFKLQGAMTDFPDHMVNMIESIFSGKHIYIDGEEYVLSGEKIFTERNVAGRSMKQLDAELVKCEIEKVHRCGCDANCDKHPVIFPPSAIVFTLAADMGLTQDNTYWYVHIDQTLLSGGTPPYIYEWIVQSGNAEQNSDLIPFINNRSYNIFRRTDLNAGLLDIQVKIQDSYGCFEVQNGHQQLPDLRCVGYDAGFTIGDVTATTIEITSITPAITGGTAYEVSWDGGATFTSSQYTFPYVITGLTPGTTYKIVLRRKCYHPGPTYAPGQIGPVEVKTD